MNTEDLFKYGVTPKEGKDAGKRFAVEAIRPGSIDVFPWGESNVPLRSFSDGTYDIWKEPKTLFEDHTIPATWGNLKKAVEAAGLGDDTRFAVHDFICGFRSAEMSTDRLRSGREGKEKTYIIVE